MVTGSGNDTKLLRNGQVLQRASHGTPREKAPPGSARALMVRTNPLLDPPIEPRPQELNLDTGSKKSIAACVAQSPQKYSAAMKSRIPKLIGLQPQVRSPDYVHNNHIKSSFEAKDPARQHFFFRSSVARFEPNRSGMFARGMHPNMQTATSSFETEKSPHLHADEKHRQRLGFFASTAPRLRTEPRPLSFDLEMLDYAAGVHQSTSHISLSQAVTISPHRVKVMSSRSSRFTSALTYATDETRNASPIREPYENGLGPGSYDPSDPSASTFSESRSSPEQYMFASGSPRLGKSKKPMTTGGNFSSVSQDQRSWSERSVGLSKDNRGLYGEGAQVGPQPGSYGMLGRAISPARRSPDSKYEVDKSPQKAQFVSHAAALPQAYAASFRSSSPRLAMSIGERRSLELPKDATDPLDLSASASSASLHLLSRESSFRPFDSQRSKSVDGRARPPHNHGLAGSFSASNLGSAVYPANLLAKPETAGFLSSTSRFQPPLAPPGLQIDVMDGVLGNITHKSWHDRGQPLTTQEQRFVTARMCAGEVAHPESETSPGPGHYSPLKAKPNWKPNEAAAPVTAPEGVLDGTSTFTARRKLKL